MRSGHRPAGVCEHCGAGFFEIKARRSSQTARSPRIVSVPSACCGPERRRRFCVTSSSSRRRCSDRRGLMPGNKRSGSRSEYHTPTVQRLCPEPVPTITHGRAPVNVVGAGRSWLALSVASLRLGRDLQDLAPSGAFALDLPVGSRTQCRPGRPQWLNCSPSEMALHRFSPVCPAVSSPGWRRFATPYGREKPEGLSCQSL